ncbi:MAG: hypothetical protein ABEN55_24180 [Bradymonadaceae bacterium]
MSDLTDRTTDLHERVQSMVDDLERHVRVLDSIDEEPEEYDADDIEAYFDDLDSALSGVDFLDEAEQALQPLEEAVDEAEQEFLANASVIVDEREIEDLELMYLEPADAPEEAALLVESPQVNQLRGGTQVLELEDGRQFEFAIEQTLVADVAEDKTGDLKLVLSLQPI